jgi:hypothetical protein
MEKVDSKKQDNILDNTIDYNETTKMITSISALIRIEKKKQKRKMKTAAKETIKFLNSPTKDIDNLSAL